MPDRIVLCMVIDGKATLYEQTGDGAEAFSTLKAPHHFDEHRAMAWALGTLSVLALDEPVEVKEREQQRALPAAKPIGERRGRHVKTNDWPSVEVLTLIESHPGLTRVELREMTRLGVKEIGNRLTSLTARQLIHRSGPAMAGRYYAVSRP